MTGAKDVVEPHHLPKYQHVISNYSFSNPKTSVTPGSEEMNLLLSPVPGSPRSVDDHDKYMENLVISGDVDYQPLGTTPLTMAQLADTTNHKINGAKALKAIASPHESVETQKKAALSKARRKTLPIRKARAHKRMRDDSSRSGSDLDSSSSQLRRNKRLASHSAELINGRVLRQRVPKSASALQEERDREKAFRKATAE